MPFVGAEISPKISVIDDVLSARFSIYHASGRSRDTARAALSTPMCRCGNVCCLLNNGQAQCSASVGKRKRTDSAGCAGLRTTLLDEAGIGRRLFDLLVFPDHFLDERRVTKFGAALAAQPLMAFSGG
jgi:hypothetical protein